MLIYLQKPDTHLVSGKKTWNKFGRKQGVYKLSKYY